MSRTELAIALAALLALPRASPAQEQPPPPRAAEERSYYQRCFGVPDWGPPPIGIYGEVPLFVPQSSGWNPGAPALASGGSTDDKLWLVVAVVAVAILPVVLYSFDAPAPRLVLQRFACPTFGFEYQGGVETSRSDPL